MRTVDHRGQRYVHVGEREHTTQDGRRTWLDLWGSWCADCGEPFVTSSPTFGARPFQPARRCQKHKVAGRVVRTIHHMAQA